MIRLATGFPIDEISRKLNLPPDKVKSHHQHIMKKMNMKTIAELKKYVIENKLV